MYKVIKIGEIIREGDKKYKLQKLQKSIADDIINAVDGFEPGVKTRSTKWENWLAELDLYTCIECRRLHGKILGEDEFIPVRPPLHDRCRCRVEPLCAVFPGYATRNGLDGADYWLKYFGKLPEYYITKQKAKTQGWKPATGNFDDVFSGMMIGGDIYKNRNGHLPQSDERVWYEADINYTNGYRNRHRILFSNDGLIFVTYDHYETFWEVI